MNKIIFLLIAFAISLKATDYSSRWSKYDILRYTTPFIENTKDKLFKRASAVEKETGEKVILNFTYFHKMDEKQKKYQEKYLKGRLSYKDMDKHISGFLVDLERNRRVVAAAEIKAAKHWDEKHKKDEKPKEEMEFTSAELFGAKIKTKKLGVILDNSGSMSRFLPKLRAEIKAKFPNSYFIEIYGSQIHTRYDQSFYDLYVKPEKGDNPFDAKWHAQSIPLKGVHFFVARRDQSNLAAIHALTTLKGVDSIYWFTDMKDIGSKVSETGVNRLNILLTKYKVKLYAHTVGRSPASKLNKVIKAHGEVIRKQVR